MKQNETKQDQTYLPLGKAILYKFRQPESPYPDKNKVYLKKTQIYSKCYFRHYCFIYKRG